MRFARLATNASSLRHCREVIMKPLSLYSFPVSLALLVLAVTSSYAQDTGTEEKGATGWSGAAKSQG